MTYNPKIKLFYGLIDSDGNLDDIYRITPAPTLSISTEFQYVNDTIIGYNYIITLTGKITAVNLADGSSSNEYNIGAVINHAHKIRKILSANGNQLIVTDEHGTERPILKAKGGILKSFDISNSPNNWVNYAEYTASIEFQAIEFIGASWKSFVQEDCSNIFLDNNTYTKDNPGIVDISKFKIKNFSDSWSFSFDENNIYDQSYFLENNNIVNVDNTNFTINYSINATGKNTYVYDTSGNVKVTPAWEQAKNFIQYRLLDQVNNLIIQVLNTDKGSACSPTAELQTLSSNKNGSPGLLSGLNNYGIFNETISCDVSESEGSFSAQYSALIKKNTSSSYSTASTKHKVSKSLKTTNTNGVPVTNISVEGTIEGLVPGGIIWYPQDIQVLEIGSFLKATNNNTSITKYNKAKDLLDKIYNSSNYEGNKDLSSNFKQALGINYSALGISDLPNDTTSGPRPISFSLTHDYINGTINYSVEYSSNAGCGRKYREISVQTSASTEVLAQFDIPRGGIGPIFQRLNTVTAPTVTVTITGVDIVQPGQFNIMNEFMQTDDIPIPINFLPSTGIMTQRQHSKNIIDGSFTVTISYICNTNGCAIN